MNIHERLQELSDKKYADFSFKLTPGVDRARFIGVRVPLLRKLAKEIVKENDYTEFLNELPHDYYDEDMLHGLIVSEIKDYEECIRQVDLFLPYVDNWAVCDIFSPKVFKKHKKELLVKIKEWVKSKETYTIRFGMEMLMSYYLDNDFKPEYLEIPTQVRSEEYYVRMMQAWFYATALAKDWDDTVKILLENRLDSWTHNKTIQKAKESYRITDEQKAYLNTLKREKNK